MIGLITHRNGDGDAFGSMLAFGKMMQSLGKEVKYFSNEPMPQIFEFLDGQINYHPTETYQPVDLLIGFDSNDQARFTIPEVIQTALQEKVKMIVIDHHLNGDMGGRATVYWNEAEKVSCTSEMIFNLYQTMGLKIDKLTANLLLVGIETDTFSLQFTNTNPGTFEVVADLMRLGARLKSVVESAFGGKPVSTMKLFGRTIKRMEVDKKTGFVTSYITREDARELNLTTESSSGVANFLEQLEGTKIIAIFEEREGGVVKVSLRSNGSETDVEKIAKSLGGGGHKKAAGLEYKGGLKEAMAAVRKAVS